MEDLDLTIVGTTLTLKGERKPDADVPSERHYLRERGAGVFGRSVQLPHKVAVDDVKAVLQNGILTVTLPKAPEVKPHKIAVKG
jgi:HSP20 family protein